MKKKLIIPAALAAILVATIALGTLNTINLNTADKEITSESFVSGSGGAIKGDLVTPNTVVEGNGGLLGNNDITKPSVIVRGGFRAPDVMPTLRNSTSAPTVSSVTVLKVTPVKAPVTKTPVVKAPVKAVTRTLAVVTPTPVIVNDTSVKAPTVTIPAPVIVDDTKVTPAPVVIPAPVIVDDSKVTPAPVVVTPTAPRGATTTPTTGLSSQSVERNTDGTFTCNQNGVTVSYTSTTMCKTEFAAYNTTGTVTIPAPRGATTTPTTGTSSQSVERNTNGTFTCNQNGVTVSTISTTMCKAEFIAYNVYGTVTK